MPLLSQSLERIQLLLSQAGLPLERLQNIYTVAGAIILSGSFFPFMKQRPAFAIIHPYLLHQLAIVMMAVLGLYLLLPVWKSIFQRLTKAPFLVALLIWMVMSLTWTVAPHNRISVLAGLITSTLYGIYLACSPLPRRHLLRLLAMTALGLMALSMLYTYGMSLGSDAFLKPHPKWMAGLYSNKNILVRLTCLAMVLAAFLLIWPGKATDAPDTRVHRAMWMAILMIGLWFITQYYTLTAKVAVPAAGASVLLVLSKVRSPRFFKMTVIVYGGIALGLIFFLNEILALAHETSGLHNRFYHWSQLLAQKSVSPWFGAGLGGYWDRLTGPWQELKLLAPLAHGHNGFIDSWLDLGLIGLGLVVANMTMLVVRALKVPFVNWHPLAYFSTALATVFVIYNLTESSLLPTNSANTFLWAIFVALSLSSLAPIESEPLPSTFGDKS